MLPRTPLLALVLLAACSSEFGLNEQAAPRGADMPAGDTATPEADADATDADTTDTGGASAPDATDTGETGGVPEDGAADDPPPEDDCVDTSDLVYVLSRDDASLYLFDPSSLTFSSLGRLACGTSASPGSMAVARDGTAYIRYSDETVYAVDIATGACARTAYSDRVTAFGSFGMGYATDSAETWRDQLYVANSEQLGRLDTNSWSLTTIGRLPSQAELTGNAEGQLWAFLPLESPAVLAQYDTTSGAQLTSVRLPNFPDAGDIDTFAFATWGGDAWLFVRVYGMGSSTDVYQVTPDGTMIRVLDDVGFDVVGAGASTCAPTDP